MLTAQSKPADSENISQTAMGKSGFIQPIEPILENNFHEDVGDSVAEKNTDTTASVQMAVIKDTENTDSIGSDSTETPPSNGMPATANAVADTKIPTPPPPLPKASRPATPRSDARDTAESLTNGANTGTTPRATNGELTARSEPIEKENIRQTNTKQSLGKSGFIQPIEPILENNFHEDVGESAAGKDTGTTTPAQVTKDAVNTNNIGSDAKETLSSEEISASPSAVVEREIQTPFPPLPKASRPSTARNTGDVSSSNSEHDDNTPIIKNESTIILDGDGELIAQSESVERENTLDGNTTTQPKERKQFKETKASTGIDDLTGVRELFTEPMDSGGLNDLTGITGLFTTNKSATSGRLQESTALNETNKLANDKQTVPAKEYTASDIHKNTTIIRKKAEQEKKTPTQASQPQETTRAKPKFVADLSTSRKGPKIINRGLDLSGVESSKYARLSNQKTTASAGSKAHQQMVNDRKLLGVYSTSNELSVARSAYRKLQDNLSNLPQSKKIIDAARKYISESPTDQKPLLSKPNSSQLAALESLGLEESATEKIILMAMVDKASESIEQDKKYQHENFMKSLGKVHKVLFGKS